MKKKLLLIGTLISITPLASVISCGIDKYANDAEQKLYNELTSPTALRILENQWQYKVLDGAKDTSGANLINKYTIATKIDNKGKITAVEQQYSPNFSSPTVQAIAIAIIQKNINADKTGKYITGLANSLLSSGVSKYNVEVDGLSANTPKIGDTVQPTDNVYTQSWLTDNGLMNHLLFSSDWRYNFTTNTPAPNQLTLNGLKLLLSDNRLTFKKDLLSSLVSYNYLNTINKKQWARVNVNENRGLTTVDQAIDSNEFTLVKEALAKKYFASWQVQLSADDSRKYAKKMQNGIASSLALENINSDQKTDETKIVNAAKYSEVRTLSTSHMYNWGSLSDGSGGTVDLNKVIDFKGITTQKASSDNLKFTLDSLKNATDLNKNYYTGFLENGKDKSANHFIQYSPTAIVHPFTEESNQATLNLIEGIMPTFDTTKNNLTFDSTSSGGSISKKESSSRFIAAYDKDVYTAAKKYYVTQVGKKGSGVAGEKDAIILEFNKDSPVQKYKKILEDKFHIDFLDSKDPE